MKKLISLIFVLQCFWLRLCLQRKRPTKKSLGHLHTQRSKNRTSGWRYCPLPQGFRKISVNIQGKDANASFPCDWIRYQHGVRLRRNRSSGRFAFAEFLRLLDHLHSLLRKTVLFEKEKGLSQKQELVFWLSLFLCKKGNAQKAKRKSLKRGKKRRNKKRGSKIPSLNMYISLRRIGLRCFQREQI